MGEKGTTALASAFMPQIKYINSYIYVAIAI